MLALSRFTRATQRRKHKHKKKERITFLVLASPRLCALVSCAYACVAPVYTLVSCAYACVYTFACVLRVNQSQGDFGVWTRRPRKNWKIESSDCYDDVTGSVDNTLQRNGTPFGVYLGVRTCEVFLCFVTIMFVLSIVLTSLFSLFCTSLVKVTGSYTEDEPTFVHCEMSLASDRRSNDEERVLFCQHKYKIIQDNNTLKWKNKFLQGYKLNNYPQDDYRADRVNGAGRLVRHLILLYLRGLFLKISTENKARGY